MVGLDWLDLDFFFHHFFQGSVPKFEFRRPRMRMGPGPAPARPGPSARALVKSYHLDKTPTT